MQVLKDQDTILDGTADLLVITCPLSTNHKDGLNKLIYAPHPFSARHKIEVSPADAKTNFEKGFAHAKSFTLEGKYLVVQALCENSDLSASSTMSILGSQTPLFYASFFKDIDANALNNLISQCNTNMSLFAKLSLMANPAFMFCAGFLLCASRRFNLVLSGGIEMMAILLIANKIASRDTIHHDHRRLHWCTSENLIKQKKEAIDALINELDFRLKAYYLQHDKLGEVK